MRFNKYSFFAFIYFFINSLALPFGLTYTAICSPLFYWWIIKERKQEPLIPFLVSLVPFMIAHIISGVDQQTYFISIINYILVYIFCQAFYTFLKKSTDPEKIYKQLLIANFIACIIALPLYFTPFNGLLWMENNISEGISNFKRLKLFTYEASYYAFLFTPIFFFYLVQVSLKQNKINSWLILLMIVVPFILSFSIGVISCIFLSLLLVFFIHIGSLLKYRRVINLISITATAIVVSLVMLWLFFPANSFFIRLENIVLGKDSSGNGRTSDAFVLALKMLQHKTAAWGIGAGQVKVLGADIVRSYYLYDLDYTNIAIPNACAETLAIFGWIGLSIRILIEIVLFFYTRVWTNYYRLLLFLFVFVYQFTGSFITNIAEYVIWILAFTNVFSSFNVKQTSSSTAC